MLPRAEEADWSRSGGIFIPPPAPATRAAIASVVSFFKITLNKRYSRERAQ